MRSNISKSRAAAAGALSIGLLVASGCSLFGGADELYTPTLANRPLEVPPDLDLPRTDGAVGVPTGSVTASGTVAAASAATATGTSAGAIAPAAPVAGVSTGFIVAGSRDEVFAKVDTALAGIDGVTVASRAQLLGVFDVNYQDVNFLVRVSDTEAGAYVSAVDPRGMPASGAAPTQLIAQLQAALGAN